MSDKPKLTEKLKALFDKYGRLAIGVYFVFYLLAWGGTVLALYLGVEIKGVTGGTGAVAAGYVVLKVTQPFRIAATAGLTPLLARWFPRLIARRPD